MYLTDPLEVFSVFYCTLAFPLTYVVGKAVRNYFSKYLCDYEKFIGFSSSCIHQVKRTNTLGELARIEQPKRGKPTIAPCPQIQPVVRLNINSQLAQTHMYAIGTHLYMPGNTDQCGYTHSALT